MTTKDKINFLETAFNRIYKDVTTRQYNIDDYIQTISFLIQLQQTIERLTRYDHYNSKKEAK